MEKNKHNSVIITVLLFSLLPVIYLLINWKSIPDNIPLHFDINLEADKAGNKSTLLLKTVLLSIISVGIGVFTLFNQRRNPKLATNTARIKKIAIASITLVSAINFLTIHSSLTSVKNDRALVLLIIAFSITIFGNYLPNLKPNYFIGIKFPWTLQDTENWRKTHHFTGRLWFFSGLLMILLYVFLPKTIIPQVFLVFIGIVVLVPIGYSFYWYKKSKSLLPGKNQS